MVPEPLKAPRPAGEGPRIPGYELGEVIGRGASGVVYRARQLAVDREVALKVLHAPLSDDPRIVQRLQREARTTARLAHPSIVSAIDMGEVDGRWWYAMEFVDGPSLAERLRQEGRLAEREALRLFIPLCEALVHLSEHGVVHRDIKPANILIDRAGGARLADLGLAFADDDPSLTRQGGTLGTPHYISPEQAVNPTAADVRSDIWSLGATLFHTLCGRQPFSGDSAAQILSAVLYARIPDPLELEPALSKGLALVVRKCLTRDPDGRYQTARELLLDLERVRERRQPKVRRRALDPVQRQHDRRRAWGIAAGLFVAAATVAFLVLRPGLGGTAEDGGAGGVGSGAYPPLESLAERAQRDPARLAQHRSELAELSAELPLEHLARWRDLNRELSSNLRREVLAVRAESEAEIEREIREKDLAAAWHTFEVEVQARVLAATGYRVADLVEEGASIRPWSVRVGEQISAATVAVVRELESGLQEWSSARLERAERLLERQDWIAARSLLELDPEEALEGAGYEDYRLPSEPLEDLLAVVRIEFDLRRRQLDDQWLYEDRGLRDWVRTRRRTLETELVDGPPRIDAAGELLAGFERELAARRLTRERMPSGLPHTGLVELDRALSELVALADRLAEEDARFELADVRELAAGTWGKREYVAALELWEEAQRALAAGAPAAGAADSGWREELTHRTRLRQEEARLLAQLLEHAALRVRELNGQVVELRVGSGGITYTGHRLIAGADPLADGFRLEGIPEELRLQELPSSQLELLAELDGTHEATPDERLLLALFRFHEGRLADARSVLRSGPLPADGLASDLVSDLLLRITDSIEAESTVARERAKEAELLLEVVMEPDRIAQSPARVRAWIDRLLREFSDVPRVRARRSELIAIKNRLSDSGTSGGDQELLRLYGPETLEHPSFGRIRMAWGFQSPSSGAWERGDWAYDGAGWKPASKVENWTALADQDGPRLILRPPLDADSFELELELERLYGVEPPQLLLISAAGFQVAFCGSALPGTDGRVRLLVGTDDMASFLGRVRDGAGVRHEALLVGDRRHQITLSANRRSGRLELFLDGRRLEEVQLAPPDSGALGIVLKSWEAVRLISAELEFDG